ncbi:MAG: Cupin 2 protein [Chloroflexi bacterium]|nr:Cupin 2 protein [Chloroflexota bacterium]
MGAQTNVPRTADPLVRTQANGANRRDRLSALTRFARSGSLAVRANAPGNEEKWMSAKDSYVRTIKAAFERSTFGDWQKEEDVRVYEDFAVEDVLALDLAPWPRLGANACFLNLYPLMEGVRSMYVAEIPPGKALEPERHLYEKLVFILEGQGTTEVWQEGESQKHVFEWGRGTVFAPPLNTWHRMYNLSSKPAKLLCATSAPQMMNGFRDADFIFNCPFSFRGRFNGEESFFTQHNERFLTSALQSALSVWETNLINDAFTAELDADLTKAEAGGLTVFEMAGNALVGHISEWPVGRYHKAHFHRADAVLLGLRSEGYVLLWPSELGGHPYENGYSDEVVEVRWGFGSIYAPPGGWYHQHFNTGKEPARHIAMRSGSRIGPGFSPLSREHGDPNWIPTLASVSQGGTLINFEDEDPEIRRRYQEALKLNRVKCQMPEASYERGAAKAWNAPR